MGYSSYSTDDRSYRSKSMDFMSVTNSVADTNRVFTQNVKKAIHETLSPFGLKFRECRDSEAHPNTLPILLGLDLTGSMLNIPKELIKDGLPTMMSTLIQRGLTDAAVCFLGIGDHECDRAPIQVAQFESGDAELDLHLTRTWLEGNGGGNAGESYLLAYYVAAYHTKHDNWEKRGKKGYLFTIGDEPCLETLPGNAIKELFGEGEAVQGGFTVAQILKKAQETYHVYHLNINEHCKGCLNEWQKRLGQNCIGVDNYMDVPKIIADIVATHEKAYGVAVTPTPSVKDEDGPSITL